MTNLATVADAATDGGVEISFDLSAEHAAAATFHTQLPLIPHWHQEIRRMRRLMLSNADYTTGTSRSSSSAEDTPILADNTPVTRRRKLDPLQVGALYQGYGTHYVDLWVGTPGQRQTLIVDTGSGVTAFPCSGCSDCGRGHHIDENFSEAKSSSYEKVPCGSCTRGTCSGTSDCRIGMSYQEGSSWSAFEAKDFVYIGGPHDHSLTKDNGGTEDIDPNHAFAFTFKMVFGCQTKLTGLFKTQLADGIMGMDDASTAFWSQMKAAGLMKNQQFSLCFTRQPVADQRGTEAGAMTLGGYDTRLHSSPMIYTTRQGGGNGGFYNVRVRKIYLRHGSGGESSKSAKKDAQLIRLNIDEDSLNHGNVIVDSGTTDTYFTRRISAEFNNAYRQLSGVTFSHSGISMSEEELRALPTILIQLAGDDAKNKKLYPSVASVPGFAVDVDPDHPYDVLLAIPPSHYMEYDDKQKKYVARFYADESGGSVLGANAMMGHDVFFDIDSKTLGWAESDCDYHTLVTKNGFVDTLTSVDEETILPSPDTKPTPASKHDDDTTTNINNNGSPDKSTGQTMHPAVAACNDTTCRGTVLATLICALIVGICIGRRCQAGQRIRYEKALNGGDVELSPTLNGKAYRDIPEDGVADDDIGYKDEVLP